MTGTRRPSPDSSNVSARPAPSPEQVATYPVVYCVFDLLEIDGEDLTGPAARRASRPG